MPITDPLVLPADILLIPVAELPAEVRRKLAGGAGEVAITRRGSRSHARLLDARSAALLEELRTPRTLSQAVIRFSQARGEDPEEVLTAAFPLFSSLLAAGFLAAEAEASPLLPTLVPGDALAGFTVRLNLQSLEDTELYLARGAGRTVALKVERQPGVAASRLAWEAAVLGHLAGHGAPGLAAAGEVAGRFYLASEWRQGTDAGTAAGELRDRSDRSDRRGLLALCREVAAAYAGLHERGVRHGDVHLRNVLVGESGEVCLIDFDRAVWPAAPAGLTAPRRGGIDFFQAPEAAAATLAEVPVPPATPAAEQYGVAVLLYRLLTGTYYRDFALERQRLLRQIVEEPPLPFAERGVAAWPEVEAVLARALAKVPEERFASVAELAAALGRIAPPAETPTVGRPARTGGATSAVLERFLARAAGEGPVVLPKPPRASVNFGGAGIAYALYRIAQTREEPALLAAADLWAARAAAETADEAFYEPGGEISRLTVGEVSPYHTASGALAVQALIGHAAGDATAWRRAAAAFLAAARRPCANLDLTLGRSGLLLAAAMLLELPGSSADPADRADASDPGLREFGAELLAGLWQELGAFPAIAECDAWPDLGIAHGWAGFLYATLRWCRAAGSARPPALAARLAELADCAEPWGRGLRWRWYGHQRRPDAGTMPGWCNGSAGLVFLWSLAQRDQGGAELGRLAEGAAWNAWEAPDRSADLCCGLTGRAYALLELYRRGAGRPWRDRAADLAERAASHLGWATEHPDSLYKGEVGLALLASDLTRPEEAVMPFFGEGW